jgi:hypothetical protein
MELVQRIGPSLTPIASDGWMTFTPHPELPGFPTHTFDVMHKEQRMLRSDCAAEVRGFLKRNIQNTAPETGSDPMYRARSAARSVESKAGSFRAKSLWSPSVPKAGPNSPDTSKARFARDICEFESSQPSQPVPSLWDMSRSQKFARHSRELSRRLRVSVRHSSQFQVTFGAFRALVSGREF